MGVHPEDWNGLPTDGSSKAGKGDDTNKRSHHDDLSTTPDEQSSLVGPFLRVLAAFILVLAQLKYQRDLRISQSPELPGRIPIRQLIFGDFPVCDPDTLASANFGATAKTPPHVRANFESSCNTFITAHLCMIILYWANVISLFWTAAGEGPWKKRYLPWVFVLGPAGAVMSSCVFRVSDPATIFLNVLPVCWNICMVGCLLHSAYMAKGGGRKTSGME
ncbi:hypothetical protein QBC37DRAFT_418984 [Rhypophila decipiens]|uniref:Uncharacterized protein n=1 Tax=Rhypophila decipiens TaxID=261697 RepID=A0AAN6YBD8_9PEZI|nr:hypothetical protein QBC37DRAFT_418984 [Rhypophila decipiens]